MTKRCGYASCPTPDVLIVSNSQHGNRKYHPACSRLARIAYDAARYTGVGKGNWTRPVKPAAEVYVHDPLSVPESPEAIERAFQQALAQIKARPRSDADVRWASTLADL